ncbi:MAG: DUF4139 domain-containing protein [Treponema sp.]|nr:DUF4139 domain-containing protein [Treponema sp.]
MKKITFLAVCCLVLPAFFAGAQNAQREPDSRAELPLRRVALFSSGIAYFQRAGIVAPSASGGQAQVTLSFDASDVNDALQSLVINDPASASPQVRYAAENALWQILRGLKIDLSASPSVAEILNALRGAELEVAAPSPIRGRIVGVQQPPYFAPPAPAEDARLSLLTSQGIRVIALGEITSFRFIDEAINTDLHRALDLILGWREDGTRNFVVTLDGSRRREVVLSYVIPAPVWKATYRLDLSGSSPFLQGWAIVDNDSGVDWENVEISLVIGRPVSFVQDLFQPYRVVRPMLPLAIAGVAEGRAHEGGFDFAGGGVRARAPMSDSAEAESANAPMFARTAAPVPQAASAPAITAGVIVTAEGQAAGDQFLLTLPNPVTLLRRQSAMLPLVEGSVRAERTLVFSGSRALSGATIHPELGAELTNTSGMPLPAGAIAVFDGGMFAGNALLGFFPKDERRFITFGEDLSVTGNAASATSRRITAVNVSGGVMTISCRESREVEYTIKNASGEERRIVIEHPVTPGADLSEPATASDRSAALYRFNRTLGAQAMLRLTVREETPLSESITLARMNPEAFLHFASNSEIPENVRAVLNRAVELRRAASDAAAHASQLETRRAHLVSEQERARLNLEAVGIDSPQGQVFLSRLVALDDDIGNFNALIEAAAREAERSQRELDDFLATITV